MKNKIKLMMMALFMCMIMVPAVKANAAGGEVWQIKATKNTATIEWTNFYNQYSSGYNVYLDGQLLASVSGTTNSYKISNLAQGSSHVICVSAIIYGQEGFLKGEFGVDEYGNLVTDGSRTYFIEILTTPKKVSGVKYYQPFAKTNKLTIGWSKDKNVDGYEAICYDQKGKKKVQTVKDINRYYVTFQKTNTTKMYRAKVRAYVYINGKKAYGDWSNQFLAVPQPKFTSTNKDVSRYSVKLKWKKVTGASQYIILKSKSKNGTYKKVATVKGSTTSYTVRNIDTLYCTHYFKVVTVGKFGKKTKKSGKEYYIEAETYYY